MSIIFKDIKFPLINFIKFQYKFFTCYNDFFKPNEKMTENVKKKVYKAIQGKQVATSESLPSSVNGLGQSCGPCAFTGHLDALFRQVQVRPRLAVKWAVECSVLHFLVPLLPIKTNAVSAKKNKCSFVLASKKKNAVSFLLKKLMTKTSLKRHRIIKP